MKSFFYIVFASICLGTIGVLVKLIGPEVPFMTLSFFRVFIGFLFLLLVAPFFDKKTFQISRKDARDYLVVGALFALSFSVFNISFLYTTIQNAVLLHYLYPFIVLFLGYFILKEKITVQKVITLVIAALGVFVLNPFSSQGLYIGNMLATISAFTFAFLVVAIKKVDRNHGVGDVMWFMFFASLVLLPFPFIFGLGNISGVYIYTLILGVVSTGIAYLFYNLALMRMEAETCSVVAIIVSPFVAIVLALLVVGEGISTRTLLGGGFLIVAGVYLETHKKQLKI